MICYCQLRHRTPVISNRFFRFFFKSQLKPALRSRAFCHFFYFRYLRRLHVIFKEYFSLFFFLSLVVISGFFQSLSSFSFRSRLGGTHGHSASPAPCPPFVSGLSLSFQLFDQCLSISDIWRWSAE